MDIANKFNYRILVCAFLFCFSLVFQVTAANKEVLDIAAWCKSGKLQLELVSLGGHQGECVQMRVKNRSAELIQTRLESGRKLVAEDSSAQDIFVVKSLFIRLAAGEERRFSANGFCCRASRHSPTKEMKFVLGEMMPSTWVQVAELIDKSSFPSSAIQAAVWALSDNHAVAAIQSDKPLVVESLRRLVAHVKGVELPWYSVAYEQDTTLLFSGRPERVWGEFSYYLPNQAMITMLIQDTRGRIMTVLTKGSVGMPGAYTYYLDQDVRKWKRGEYEFRILEDGANLNLKKKFIL
jgi:hypothetical protein